MTENDGLPGFYMDLNHEIKSDNTIIKDCRAGATVEKKEKNPVVMGKNYNKVMSEIKESLSKIK